MDWLTDPQIWAGLLTLTALEIVLGIDGLLFLAVLVARVQGRAPTASAWLGLGLALGAGWRCSSASVGSLTWRATGVHRR